MEIGRITTTVDIPDRVLERMEADLPELDLDEEARLAADALARLAR